MQILSSKGEKLRRKEIDAKTYLHNLNEECRKRNMLGLQKNVKDIKRNSSNKKQNWHEVRRISTDQEYHRRKFKKKKVEEKTGREH